MKNLTYINFIVLLIMSIWTNAALATPSITAATSQGTTIKFTATLSEKLLSGYKVKIDYGNGKGLVAMTCSGLTCTLSSNSLPIGVNSAAYKIGIYNSKGILQGATTSGDYVIASTQSTAGYTKISNSGTELPDTALFGSAQDNWACTRDNKTGLIWEIKTADGGFRDLNKTYTNYFSVDTNYGATNNSDYFVKLVNQKTLCGAANWRLPTVDELKGLIFCSDGKYDSDGSCTNYEKIILPVINTKYFPDITEKYWFWSSSPYADINYVAWVVRFNDGVSYYFSNKNNNHSIRLVR